MPLRPAREGGATIRGWTTNPRPCRPRRWPVCRAALGAEHVRTDRDAITTHTRDTSLWHRVPAVIVFPADTGQVAETVRVAAEFDLEVWPFSRGKNWGYGATMAYRRGAVIVVLERMNRIVEVDEELAYAVIEPGVTQRQLREHLDQRGSKLWTDCTDSTPEASVIGNALERGVGYTPYWDHFGHLCGLEVVMADGTVVQTGGGAPGSLTAHTYKWGTGPYLEGLFSQSNLGIVTQAGVWLLPEPEAFETFVCEVADPGHQPAVMDAIRGLTLRRLLPANVHVVNDILTLAQMIQYPYHLTAGAGRLPGDVRDQLQRRYRVTPWTVVGGLYGSAAQVCVARRAVSDALKPFGKVTFFNARKMGLLSGVLRFWGAARSVPGVTPLLSRLTGSSLERLGVLPHLYSILQGVPGDFIVRFAYFKMPWRPERDVDPARDGAGLTWLAVVSPLTGRHTQELLQLVEPVFEKHGLDLSVAFIMVNERSTLCLIEIFFDRHSDRERQASKAVYEELADLTAAAGYPQYRTSVGYSDRILAGAPAFHRVADQLKEALDPHGVIAPGRYGVGPPGGDGPPGDGGS